MSQANEQAFPRAGFDGPDCREESINGLTKREYFAAMAMQGMLSNKNIVIDKRLGEAAVAAAENLLLALSENKGKENAREEITS